MNFNRDLWKLNEGHFQKAWYPRTRNEIFYIMVHIQSNFKIFAQNRPPYSTLISLRKFDIDFYPDQPT